MKTVCVYKRMGLISEGNLFRPWFVARYYELGPSHPHQMLLRTDDESNVVGRVNPPGKRAYQFALWRNIPLIATDGTQIHPANQYEFHPNPSIVSEPGSGMSWKHFEKICQDRGRGWDLCPIEQLCQDGYETPTETKSGNRKCLRGNPKGNTQGAWTAIQGSPCSGTSPSCPENQWVQCEGDGNSCRTWEKLNGIGNGPVWGTEPASGQKGYGFQALCCESNSVDKVFKLRQGLSYVAMSDRSHNEHSWHLGHRIHVPTYHGLSHRRRGIGALMHWTNWYPEPLDENLYEGMEWTNTNGGGTVCAELVYPDKCKAKCTHGYTRIGPGSGDGEYQTSFCYGGTSATPGEVTLSYDRDWPFPLCKRVECTFPKSMLPNVSGITRAYWVAHSKSGLLITNANDCRTFYLGLDNTIRCEAKPSYGYYFAAPSPDKGVTQGPEMPNAEVELVSNFESVPLRSGAGEPNGQWTEACTVDDLGGQDPRWDTNFEARAAECICDSLVKHAAYVSWRGVSTSLAERRVTFKGGSYSVNA